MSRVPVVIEKDDKDNERAYDLYSRMLKDRIIFINGEFNQDMADSVVAQLLFLEADDNEKDIMMYINSPGGAITAMNAIYDTMQYIKSDIVTIGYGQCCSAGSFILAAGTKGKRHVLPSTEIMIHELSAGNQGKYHDMKARWEHTANLYERMAKKYVEFTGKPLKTIKEDMETDNWMIGSEAVEYGLVDKVEDARK